MRNYSVIRFVHIFMIAAMIWGANALAATDLIHAYQDTQVRIINNGPWGSLTRLRIDYDGANQSRHTLAAIDFRVNHIDVVHKAELLLDVETFTSHYSTTRFNIFGVSENAPEETWDESSLKYLDWNYFLDGSSDGVAAGSWRITPLGTLDVARSELNQTVSFSTDALADFLELNQNGKVTIIISRQTNNYNFRTAFASKEHGSLKGPRLSVTSKDRYLTPHDDTWCQKGDKDAVHGQDDQLWVKNDEDGDASTVRKAVMEFHLHADVVARDVSLTLTPDAIGNGLSSATFYVWGFSDTSGFENWSENSANWRTFDAVFDDSSDGMENNSSKLWDGDVTKSDRQSLGQFTITTADIDNPVTFSSDALLNFINDNENNYINIALTRKTDHAGVSKFYSDESAHGSPHVGTANTPFRFRVHLYGCGLRR